MGKAQIRVMILLPPAGLRVKMDLTFSTYRHLLKTLITNEYSFLPFKNYLEHFSISGKGEEQTNEQKNRSNYIILRHDVDRLPENSLRMAELESKLSITSAYYFRTKSLSFDKKIIAEIADLGHEIGYHYENMDSCNGDIDEAWDDFRRKLDKLRELYPVKTICMHGSPLSKHDNRDLWEEYDYRSEGIIGEPYFDIDFDEVFYLTDTGRRWDGGNVSVRDKVESDESIDWPSYSNTFDIIEAVEGGTFPNKAMINVHPHRWFEFGTGWIKEFVFQNIKNIGKFFLAKYRDS